MTKAPAGYTQTKNDKKRKYSPHLLVGVDSRTKSPPPQPLLLGARCRVSGSPGSLYGLCTYMVVGVRGRGGPRGLPEQAVGARQAPILAGQGGLDVFEGGQLREVSQCRHRRLAAQHLRGDALDVTGGNVAWQRQERVVFMYKHSVFTFLYKPAICLVFTHIFSSHAKET